MTHRMPRSGGASGPRSSLAWAGPVRISSKNSIPLVVGLGPSRRTDSRSVRRGERALGKGQELAGQLATPAGQLLRRPLGRSDRTVSQEFPHPTDSTSERGPQPDPVEENSISSICEMGRIISLKALYLVLRSQVALNIFFLT